MRLKEISVILSGYLSREKIEPREEGNHFLLQARNVDGACLRYDTSDLIRFYPTLSAKDRFLEQGDILFMARGAHNFSILLMADIPFGTLAAACFFIIRVRDERVLPEYLCWYLNQEPVAQYFQRNSGKGVHMPVVKRAVLENLDIPLPPPVTQKIVAEIDILQRKEQELVRQLEAKRKKLLAAVCLQATFKKSAMKKKNDG